MDLIEIEQTLKNLLVEQVPPLQARQDDEKGFEVAGTKEAMQGKKKVDGYYFGSVIAKAKDVRLYFFPIYTHVSEFEFSADLKKMLKGKSCFHIKELNDDLIIEIREMIGKGIKLYKEQNLV